MVGYIVNPIGGFLSIGPSSPRVGCMVNLRESVLVYGLVIPRSDYGLQ